MNLRNALLCWLLGEAAPPPDVLDAAARADAAREDGLLLGMCLARSGQLGRFGVLVGRLDHADMAALSRYCLFLGLSDDTWHRAFLLFDVLKRQAPTCVSLWIDLAVLQAAWNFPAASMRSMAMHKALTGGGSEGAELAFAEPEAQLATGPIHFLPGDATRFIRA